MKKGWLVLGIVVFSLLLVYSLYFLFYYKNCSDLTCFYSSMEGCHRATYTNYGNLSFEYTIRGVNDEKCEVKVKLIRDFLRLENFSSALGTDMKCSLPLGVVVFPENNLANCHGILKEQLQEKIIEKMHGYIVKNLGRIDFTVY